MRSVTALTTLVSMVAVAVVVYAGDGFSMKCKSKTCSYESEVRFGGGMVSEQITGYCRKCKNFVYIHWTREGSPVLDSTAKKVAPPKPIGEVWDARSGNAITVYSCPQCSGPFAEIKTSADLTHCPSCSKPDFAIDDTKPRIAID